MHGKRQKTIARPDRLGGGLLRARACDGYGARGERDQEPGGHVVDGRAGERKHADGALEHPAGSPRMRASTGKAVMDIETPMKSANATNFL